MCAVMPNRMLDVFFCKASLEILWESSILSVNMLHGCWKIDREYAKRCRRLCALGIYNRTS